MQSTIQPYLPFILYLKLYKSSVGNNSNVIEFSLTQQCFTSAKCTATPAETLFRQDKEQRLHIYAASQISNNDYKINFSRSTVKTGEVVHYVFSESN